MRTAKAQGMHTIAIYSDVDAVAPHTLFADESVCIGGASVSDSYLRSDKIIEAAIAHEADAIHPGYGLLSENADFARAVAAAGLIFVGPPAEAIEIMGDKARAKRHMLEAGVPCIQGYQGADQRAENLSAEAEKIGYPIMVKAASGGGGRGMRLVASAEGLVEALALARSEAENAFGSGQLILEKAVQRPRHVEIQVFADSLGNAVHLGERDCSIQRRHQKVLEESPCPIMTEDLRRAMGAAAVEAARAVQYQGAGTVEFLLDEAGQFFFLEMNTRLQVEHPVTEMVTGLDLVAMQLAVASGQPLGIAQQDVALLGHAIEVRLCAEDPSRDFLPSTGMIHLWAPSESVRTDAGIANASEVSPYYDSMVAKIIAWGADREAARRKLLQALGETALFGPATNRDFLIDVVGQPEFANGHATTAFIAETYGDHGWVETAPSVSDIACAAVIEYLLDQDAAKRNAYVSEELLNWSSAGDLQTAYRYLVDDINFEVRVKPATTGYAVEVNGEEIALRAEFVGNNVVRFTQSGRCYSVTFTRLVSGRLFLALPSKSFSVMESTRLILGGNESAGSGEVIAPMHGQMLEVLVRVGDVVQVGEKLAILEAMKMQHEIVANVAGSVTEVLVKPGQQLAADTLILVIEPSDPT